MRSAAGNKRACDLTKSPVALLETAPPPATARAVRWSASCDLGQRDRSEGVLVPSPPHARVFVHRPGLVQQDHEVNAVATLYATEGMGVGFVRMGQIIAPVMHEQTGATGARSCEELFGHRS